VNVVTLYAMVFERQHYGVVLEFVPRGCLEDYIHKHKVLCIILYEVFFFISQGCQNSSRQVHFYSISILQGDA